MLIAAIIKSLQVYAIAIVVSLMVALLIKLLVSITARLEKTKSEELAPGAVLPIEPGVPEEDVAALSAAIFVAIGPHRILRIGQARHGWGGGARAAQHSHKQAHAGRGSR